MSISRGQMVFNVLQVLLNGCLIASIMILNQKAGIGLF